jgi:hypothetical protein
MANGDTKTQSYLRAAAEGSRADLPADTCCNTKTQDLILGVAERIMDVEDEVERLENNPDVVDIVATYQDLQNYNTSDLTDKDIIRVLEDSTHSNNSTYYRWNANTNQFDFVGEISAGSLAYFTSVTPDTVTTGVTLYSDSAHTTPVSLATFFSALRNGKTVWLEYRRGEGEDDLRYRYQIISAFLTNVDTEEAYNEVMPSAMYYSSSGIRRLQAFEIDPTATTNAFSIDQ